MSKDNLTVGEMFKMFGVSLSEFNSLIERIGVACEDIEPAIAYLALRSVCGFMEREIIEKPEGYEIVHALAKLSDKLDRENKHVA